MPNIALPRPLPRPRSRRGVRPADAVLPVDVAAPDIIEAAGLRWIHIEIAAQSPTATGSRSTSTSTRSTTRTSTRATTARSSTSTTTTSSSSCTSRCFEKDQARILTAELDLFMGPDYLITLPNVPLPPLAAMFERYREKDDLREDDVLEGLGLPALQDRRHRASTPSFPMLRKMGLKLDRLEDDIFEGRSSEIVREISDAKQEIINFRKIVRPQRAVLRDLERTKQRYLQEELEIYFDDISDAAERIWDTLENYKEVVEALESTNESVLSHRLNDSFRVLTAVSVVLLPLTLIASIFGMNVPFPGEGEPFAFLGDRRR